MTLHPIPVAYEVGRLSVEKRGEDSWCVTDGAAAVLNADGLWEYEPRPSNRCPRFLARTRFPRDEAIRRAIEAQR